MFKLFVEFISFIMANLEACFIDNNDENNELSKHILAIYMLLKRIDRKMDTLTNTLKVWQRDFYHGSAWSAAHAHVSNIQIVMSLISEDLDYLIRIQNPELDCDKEKLLRYQFLGDVFCSKTDAFQIWKRILEQNIRSKFCNWISHYSKTKGKTLNAFGEIKFSGDVENRIIFIPTHSLLLPHVRRTANLYDLSQTQWKRDIGILFMDEIPSNYQTKWCQDILGFLPEFPPVVSIAPEESQQLYQNLYALRIEVPAQEEIMAEMLTSIEQGTSNFHQSFNQLKNTLRGGLKKSMEIIW